MPLLFVFALHPEKLPLSKPSLKIRSEAVEVVGVLVAVGVFVDVGPKVGVLVWVGVFVAVGVLVGVDVEPLVAVGVGVFVLVGVAVNVAVGVLVGIAEDNVY